MRSSSDHCSSVDHSIALCMQLLTLYIFMHAYTRIIPDKVYILADPRQGALSAQASGTLNAPILGRARTNARMHCTHIHTHGGTYTPPRNDTRTHTCTVTCTNTPKQHMHHVLLELTMPSDPVIPWADAQALPHPPGPDCLVHLT